MPAPESGLWSRPALFARNRNWNNRFLYNLISIHRCEFGCRAPIDFLRSRHFRIKTRFRKNLDAPGNCCTGGTSRVRCISVHLDFSEWFFFVLVETEESAADGGRSKRGKKSTASRDGGVWRRAVASPTRGKLSAAKELFTTTAARSYTHVYYTFIIRIRTFPPDIENCM